MSREAEIHLLADERARNLAFDLEVNQRLLTPYASKKIRMFVEHAMLEFLDEVKKLDATLDTNTSRSQKNE